MSEFARGDRVKVKDGRGWKHGTVESQTQGPATRIKFEDGSTLNVSNKIIVKKES